MIKYSMHVGASMNGVELGINLIESNWTCVNLAIFRWFWVGRNDFVGGIDNEALHFHQLDSVLVAGGNGAAASGNLSTAAITLSVTAITTATTPVHVVTSVSSSATSLHASNGGTSSHLPESPPDSGSEPPYSPADLHAIHHLSQLGYPNQANAPPSSQQHQSPSSSANLLATHHNHGIAGVAIANCAPSQAIQMRHQHILRDINLPGGNINHVHKTEDIMLSSTIAAVPVPGSINLANVDLIMQPSVSTIQPRLTLSRFDL